MTATAIATYTRITPKGVFATSYTDGERQEIIAAIKANSAFYALLDNTSRRYLDSDSSFEVEQGLINVYRLEDLIAFRANGQKRGENEKVDEFIARFVTGELPPPLEVPGSVASAQPKRRGPRRSGRRASAAAQNGNGRPGPQSDPAAATEAEPVAAAPVAVFSENAQPEPAPEEEEDNSWRLELRDAGLALLEQFPHRDTLPAYYRCKVSRLEERLLAIDTLTREQADRALSGLNGLLIRLLSRSDTTGKAAALSPEEQSAEALRRKEAYAVLGEANRTGPNPAATRRGMPVATTKKNGKPKGAKK